MRLVDLVEHQRKFSYRTFGPGMRTASILDHIEDEIEEVALAPHSLEEWADIILLALDGAWRTGATALQVSEAILAKMEKNENREWPDWRESDLTKRIEHIEPEPQADGHPGDEEEETEEERIARYLDDSRADEAADLLEEAEDIMKVPNVASSALREAATLDEVLTVSIAATCIPTFPGLTELRDKSCQILLDIVQNWPEEDR